MAATVTCSAGSDSLSNEIIIDFFLKEVHCAAITADIPCGSIASLEVQASSQTAGKPLSRTGWFHCERFIIFEPITASLMT
jgi:hypothetical protein